MAYEKLDASDLRTGVAGADHTSNQHKFIIQELKSGVLKTVVAATAGARVDGVLQDNPAVEGQACLIAGSGISKVVAGGPVLPGEYVMTSNAGLAITSAATAYHRVGKALEQAAVSGEKIAVQLGSFGPNVP